MSISSVAQINLRETKLLRKKKGRKKISKCVYAGNGQRGVRKSCDTSVIISVSMGRQFKEAEQRSELLGNCHTSNKHSRTANQSGEEAGRKSPGGGVGVSAAQIKKAEQTRGKTGARWMGRADDPA